MTMNLADPELELIDPTPNLSSMFLHFDKTFFRSRLAGQCIVKWSKRMYSSAGTCSYEGGAKGLCVISLSEPLLKLRPRKDFVETLLHEMIHAYLFVTRQDQYRDGHGPKFQAHMHRINAAAGLNISIYHDFHDEVRLYQTHWWRCTGRCQRIRPHFGIVRRFVNRPPGPSEYWWLNHQATCGGTFIKIKEPEQPERKNQKQEKKTVLSKENGDIRKYIITNNGIPNNKPKKPVLKDSNMSSNPRVRIDKKNTSTFVVAKTNEFPQSTPVIFSGTATSTNNGKRSSTTSSDVFETVRNVWCNKQIASNSIPKDVNSNNVSSLNNVTPDTAEITEGIIKKYRDYAFSVIKKLYGEDCDVTEIIKGDTRSVRVESEAKNIVDCPVCNKRIDTDAINRHLDECLNKELIEELTQETNPLVEKDSFVTGQNLDSTVDAVKSRAVADDLVTESRTNESVSQNHSYRNISKAVNNNQVPDIDIIDLTNNNFVTDIKRKRSRTTFDHDDIRATEQISSIDKKNKIRKSNSFVGPHASYIVDQASPILVKSWKNEPGSSDDYNSKSKKSASDIVKQTSPILIKPWKNEPGSSDDYNSKFKKSASNIVKQPFPILTNFEDNERVSGKYNSKSHIDMDTLIAENKSNTKADQDSNNQETLQKTETESICIDTRNTGVCGSDCNLTDKACPCCGDKLTTSLVEHLDECLSFIEDSTTIPQEGASTSNETIVIDDSGIIDESQMFNATGTKFPCPCCMKMMEEIDMNTHLDTCLVNGNIW